MMLVVMTTATHSICTAVAIGVLRRLRLEEQKLHILISGTIMTAGLVLLLFGVAVVESGFYAVTFVKVGAMPDFESALYFSVVTFTTLGYGDLVVDEPWRLLTAAEGINGLMMFGWTTGLIVAVLTRLAQARRDADGPVPPSPPQK